MTEKVILEGKEWGFHPPVEIYKDSINDVWVRWVQNHGSLTPEQADTIRYAMSKAVYDQMTINSQQLRSQSNTPSVLNSNGGHDAEHGPIGAKKDLKRTEGVSPCPTGPIKPKELRPDTK